LYRAAQLHRLAVAARRAITEVDPKAIIDNADQNIRVVVKTADDICGSEININESGSDGDHLFDLAGPSSDGDGITVLGPAVAVDFDNDELLGHTRCWEDTK
jgi:hypothetical protein